MAELPIVCKGCVPPWDACMRIETFTVSGFANFVRPVTVGPLEEVNVLYGPNNAGKSNLLRALELYFRLLGAGENVGKDQPQMLEGGEDGWQHWLDGAFNRGEPGTITFQVEWSLSDRDIEAVGLHKETPCSRVFTELTLKPSGRTYELRVQKWRLADRDVAALDRAKEPSVAGFAQQVRRLLADACPFQFDQPVLPWALMGQSTGGFPQELRDALFDARQSLSSATRKRWTVFASLAGTLAKELGEGAWDTAFDRATGRAELIYLAEQNHTRLESMGAGVVRLASLLGELVLAKEPCICLEEPEFRLSPELQRRFIALARRTLAIGAGPRQLFITTHSPTMAAQGASFLVEVRDGVPVVEQKPWAGYEEQEGAAAEGGDLSHLIGLVETLAELDPSGLVGAKSLVAA